MGAYIETSYPAGIVGGLRGKSFPPVVEESKAAEQVAPLKAPSRWGTMATFLFADVAALLAATGICIALFDWALGVTELPRATAFLPALGVLIGVYAMSGLYAGVAMHPAEEMRRASVATTIFFAALAAVILLQEGVAWGAGILIVLAWGITTLCVMLSRAFSRILCARCSWWGYPVAILGQGEAAVATVKTLKRAPELGLKPVALLDDTLTCQDVEGVPLCGKTNAAAVLALDHKIPYAIIAVSGEPRRQLIEMIGYYTKFYERVLVIPGVANSQTLWTTTKFFNGMLGFDVQHSHRKLATQFFKRAFDVCFAGLGLILLSPLWLVITALIKLDSSGPVYFRQIRMGQGGRAFKVLKFRSMYTDAEQRLRDILAQDAEMRAEYETFRKLRRDPRITETGKILRRYSLDEVPQLWNVLRGDMSLVGPRAYMPNELYAMESMERIILQNPPGITGLWQVSGRNNLSFEDRVSLDVHYIHNWSFWLDLYILIRTIPVVLTGEGAC